MTFDPSIHNHSKKPENTMGLHDSAPDTQPISTGSNSLFLEALVDAIEDGSINNSTHAQNFSNNGVNTRLPSLSSLTSSLQNSPRNTTLPYYNIYGVRYKDYMSAYMAYCQAYQYAATMTYHQQRAFANTLPRQYPNSTRIPPMNTNNSAENSRHSYPPIAIKSQDDPPFTGRYGHDDLVKAYSRPKPPGVVQHIPNTPVNNSSDDALRGRENDMSDSENSDDPQDTINGDEESSDSMNLSTSDRSMMVHESNQDTQRRAHKFAERRRRNEMRQLFEQLKDLLPNIPQSEKQKLSKWDVLSQTVNTIDALLHKKALLISKKNYLIPRIKSQSIDASSIISSESIDFAKEAGKESDKQLDNEEKKSPCLDTLVTIVNSP